MKTETLIIGGNGYIGSTLFKKINADSVDLCLFGKDLGYSTKENFNNTDITKYKNIVLLAGHSSVQMCEYNKTNAWVNNVDYFYNLCEKLSDDQLLIYASSGSVYGQTSKLSKEEDINLNPIIHYDMTKLTIDIIANKFINNGKNIVGLRFGTVNGKSVNTRADLMINSMILSFTTKGYIQTKNDWVKRPILGIDDLTNGIKAIIEKQTRNAGQYNMCSFNSSVKEIANKVAAKTGCKIIKMTDDVKFYDFQINAEKFENTFGYKFTNTIDSIIEELQTIDLTFFSTRSDDRNFTHD
jgi:nucleoside-diphosphate-sugar epimerase